jgi:hypothetical protein
MVEVPIEDERPKYFVFKADDYNHQEHPRPLNDAVVIRLKDPFAPTALFTYCNTIMSFLELMESHVENFNEDDHQQLLDIADYFHQQACESEKIKGKKLPD